MSSNTFTLGTKSVNRLGYGAMQLAGPGVFGPPRDRHVAITVLREALALGVTHIDTSDFYGPHVTNQIIREALYPYSDDLTIVTKIGARRGEDASWLPAFSPAELQKAVHDNLRNLGLDVLDVVNLRVMMGDGHGPAEGSIEASLTVLAEMQQQGLVKHIGLSNVTPTQVAEARKIAEIVCVQNEYNIAHRADDAMIDALAHDGCLRAVLPARGLYTAAIVHTFRCCCEPGCNTHAGGAGVAVTTFTEYFADPRDVFCCAFTGEYGC